MTDPTPVFEPTAEDLALTLAALLVLRAEGPTDVRMGICGNAADNANAAANAAAKDKAIAEAHAEALARGTTASGMLCYVNVYVTVYRTINSVAGGWQRNSGELRYPVPHPSMTAEAGFYSCSDLWAVGDYGDSRRELLDYLIEEMTKRTAVTPAPGR